MDDMVTNKGNIIKVAREPKLVYNKGIGEIIFDKLNENKDLPFQIDGLSGELDTNAAVLQKSIRTAIKMQTMGLTTDDTISISSHNHLNTNIPVLASYFIGVKTAFLDPSLSPSDTAYLLKLTKPKVVFASPNGLATLEEALNEIGIDPTVVVFGCSDKYMEFSQFLVDSPQKEESFRPVEIKNLKETVSIFFSSGTTGMPKGILINHLSLIRQFSILKDTMPKDKVFDNMRMLCYSSLYWISSMIAMLNTIALNGCRLVLPTFEVEDFWRVLHEFKINYAILSPTQLAIVSSSKKPENIDVTNLITVISGGSHIHKEQLDKLRKMLPNTVVMSGYGQTEMTGLTIYFNISRGEDRYLYKKETSCGRPQPGYTYKVVDLETERPLGPNEKGELRIKTDFCMTGYLSEVDSGTAWDSDGFLKTGDVAYYDEDYCFYIVERIKSILKFQGWQIVPAKLESILLSHPNVEKALVIGLPHPVDVDHLTGIVQLRKHLNEITADDINRYFEERIDHDRYRLRGGLKIMDEIPLTPSGKYKRNYIKELILAGGL